MARLWYVWTEGHMGATGDPPSGPICQEPVLADSKREAIEKIKPKLTSWDGEIKKVTLDPDYAPRKRWSW